MHYYSCRQPVVPGIVILLSEQAETVEGNEGFVSHLTIKETNILLGKYTRATKFLRQSRVIN